MELSAISIRNFTGFPKPSRLTRKHHLLNAQIHRKLSKSIHGNATGDREDEFDQERLLRRVDRIHNTDAFKGLAEMDFLDYGDRAEALHLQDTLPRCPNDNFYPPREQIGETAYNVVNGVLTNRVSFLDRRIFLTERFGVYRVELSTIS